MGEIRLPEIVHKLWLSQQELAQHYSWTKLKFTLDGRLVGDIAEALALEEFGLQLPPKRTRGVDALTSKGETVQVKAVGKADVGPAFSPGEGSAKYLLFFRIDFERNVATVAYNGLEAPVRALLPKGFTGSKRVSLSQIAKLASSVDSEVGLPRVRGNRVWGG